MKHGKKSGGKAAVETGLKPGVAPSGNANVSRGANMAKGSGQVATGSQCAHNRAGKGPYAPR